MKCERGLGWPVDNPTRAEQDREQIVTELVEWREQHAAEWSPKRGIWNLAILIASGFFRRP